MLLNYSTDFSLERKVMLFIEIKKGYQGLFMHHRED